MCIRTTKTTSDKRVMAPSVQEFNDLVTRLGMKRPRKQVHFAPRTCTLPSRDEISSEEHAMRWYQAADLAQFKLQAKAHIVSRIKNNGCSPKDEEETTSRGFERYTVERAQNKAVAIKCTLMAVRKGYSEESICQVARKGSEWFKKCAFAQACEDYCDAYQPDMKHLLPEHPSCNSPFAKYLKKRDASPVAPTEVEHQSKRRRVSALTC